MSEKELFKKLTSLHLTQEEKRFMRQNVILRSRERGVLSPITSLFFFSQSFVRVTAFALLFVIGTTVVHGAERSIPGDTLYGMKRSVNEQVLGVFAVSDDAKARLETKFVDRRLEEIQKIIVQEDTEDIARDQSTGEDEQELSISEETLAIVESLTEEVLHHAELAETHIANVSDAGAADDALVLASKLESAIDVGTSTLVTLVEDGGEEGTLIAIAETVQILSDSSTSAEELGDTIAVALVEDVSIVDKEKAEEQLAEAEKLLAMYFVENPIVVEVPATDIAPQATDVAETAREYAPAIDTEIPAETPIETIALMSAPMLTEEVLPTEPTIPQEEVVSAPQEIIEETPIEVVTSETPGAYVAPTIEEVQAQVASCRAFIAQADYTNAYIVCTEALQNISTITNIQEKKAETVAAIVTVETEVITTETPVAGTEDLRIDPSSMTGRVLDALNTEIQN